MRERTIPISILLLLIVLGRFIFGDTAGWLYMEPATACAKEQKDIVIMIDPGHGGENLGGQPGTYDEKAITLKTADAMRRELEKYEGVIVYMTRTEDVDLTLEERAALAKAVEADFLISIHYNMSAEHEFYGAEVWTQSVGSNYAKGQTLGKVLLDEYGKTFPNLYMKGVKVKLGQNRADYYGVLRESAKNGIPAVIAEHCYMDHPKDADYCNEDADYEAFGRADAAAVARYFGLRSTQLNVDYSKSIPKQVKIPRRVMKQDMTPPEVTEVQVDYKDTKNGLLGLKVKASDEDSGILYFSCSVDGGQTWSLLQRWEGERTEYRIEVTVQFTDAEQTAMVRSYNGYDLMTQSAPVSY